MTNEQWIEVAMNLLAIVDRNVQSWQRGFSEEQLEALGEHFGKEFPFIEDRFGSGD